MSWVIFCKNFCYLDIEQEQARISFDNEVKIIPVNSDEKMEEGHYDEIGCLQLKKRDVCSFLHWSIVFSSEYLYQKV